MNCHDQGRPGNPSTVVAQPHPLRGIAEVVCGGLGAGLLAHDGRARLPVNPTSAARAWACIPRVRAGSNRLVRERPLLHTSPGDGICGLLLDEPSSHGPVQRP